MKDLENKIQSLLGSQLAGEGYDVELVPIPSSGDRLVRIRTLEEALEDFNESDGTNSVGYLIQLRPSKPMPLPPAAPASPTEAIYLEDGKINFAFLAKNADLLFESGEYVLARQIYTSLQRTGEKTGWVLHRLGRCHEAEGNVAEARAKYEESISYQPTLDAYQRLAALLSKEKKDQEAAETLERASHLRGIEDNTRVEILKACGNAWLRAGKHAESERNYLSALELQPKSDAVLANLAALCLQTGRLADAKRRYVEAITINPRNHKAYAGLGSCFLASGEKRQAHDAFARSLDIELNNASAVFHLVKCAYEIKSYAIAARIVSEYVQIAPVNINLLYSLAGLQYHLGRTADAKATVAQILSLQSEHTGAKELEKLLFANG